MHALVYHEPGRISWDTVPDPAIEAPTDAIVRIDTATVCGSDLHILNGEVPEVRPGTVLGHEAVGVVTDIGPEVHRTQPGDHVVVSCVSACGNCVYCRERMYGQCRGGGGWILGNQIHGTQAEYVRVPFSDHSTHRIHDGMHHEDAVLLSEVLPTAYEVGVRNGHVSPGDHVVVVGAGPVGLATVITAQIYSPRRTVAVDLSSARLERAARLGADAAQLPGELLAELAEGRGADVAVEAAGNPDSFVLCTRAVRPGGQIANIGMHGRPAVLHLEAMWRKNLTISTGQVDTFSTPLLMNLLTAGRLHVTDLVTHQLALDQAEEAYDMFAHGPETGTLKVVLRAERNGTHGTGGDARATLG
ncbi:alcohol dehydrogenase [Streptomyces sulfonofaciens]|uniref:Alcohol dehydrogenase n=1 Tax=Streptomyces sulfonofaciens TaxID=68272 RepID=A0A919GDV9_9ACTN|nr:alcohol dehydrogenase catalytic domain-containing protein [Streptomyces sulfonofaciens]GHH82832.1 alcohol dehydrogenase [Streptomyces sulfonofaciens]